MCTNDDERFICEFPYRLLKLHKNQILLKKNLHLQKQKPIRKLLIQIVRSPYPREIYFADITPAKPLSKRMNLS